MGAMHDVGPPTWTRHEFDARPLPARAASDNAASLRVRRKAGFQVRRRVVFHRDAAHRLYAERDFDVLAPRLS
jgi:RimJ/RimL family protein N-acetyltransferase